MEYASYGTAGAINNIFLTRLKADFVHSPATQQKEKDTGKKMARAAEEVSNHPTLLVQIDRGTIEKSEFGFVNASDQSFLSGIYGGYDYRI